MKTFTLLVLLGIIYGCGYSNSAQPVEFDKEISIREEANKITGKNGGQILVSDEVYAEVGIYLEDFKDLLDFYGVEPFYPVEGIIVEFIDKYTTKIKTGRVIATCEMVDRIITISKYDWDRWSELEKENVLFHELGHCALNRGHTVQKFDDGTPYSLMYFQKMSEYVYESNRDHYREELITGN